MRSVLITGCNRGIGLGLVRSLVQGTVFQPEHIFATCRNIGKATELVSLADSSSKIHIIEIDLTDTNNFDKIYEKVNEKVGPSGLNLLINNAGISTKFARIGMIKEQQLMDNFKVNTISPILLTQTLLPLLKKAASHRANAEMSVSRAAVVNVSSSLGSIAQNDSGGYYPYRCSKSALNAATKSMSIDLKDQGILTIAMHPGWVKTDMGGTKAPMEVDNCVQIILSTLKTVKNDKNGAFLQYDGSLLPW